LVTRESIQSSLNMKKVPAPVTATKAEIIATFTEWDRRYRENPEQFMSEAVHLLKQTPKTYGHAATPYFLKILGEIQSR
jgi:hypothetical protein